MRHAAVRDGLTGLHNGTSFLDLLEHALTRAQRRGHTVAVAYFDVDGFKEINDRFGHSQGDRVLQEVARRLTATLRTSDTVARAGGDEFAVLLDDLAGRHDALTLAGRLLASMHDPVTTPGVALSVRLSGGIAFNDTGETTAEQQLANADHAMYRAKRDRAGSVVVFDPSFRALVEATTATKRILGGAAARDELRIQFQPIVGLGTRTGDALSLDAPAGSIVALEALVCWADPTHGLRQPTEFIALAEESGDIIPVGQWVLGEACRGLREWQDLRGASGLRMMVSLSAPEIMHPRLEDGISQTVASYGLDPRSIVFEVTEAVLSMDDIRAQSVLARPRQAGFGLMVDDFGTGGALSQLREMPVPGLTVGTPSSTTRSEVTRTRPCCGPSSTSGRPLACPSPRRASRRLKSSGWSARWASTWPRAPCSRGRSSRPRWWLCSRPPNGPGTHGSGPMPPGGLCPLPCVHVAPARPLGGGRPHDRQPFPRSGRPPRCEPASRVRPGVPEGTTWHRVTIRRVNIGQSRGTQSRPSVTDGGLDPAQRAGSGDTPIHDLRAALHRATDMVADYLLGIEDMDVLPTVEPADLRARLASPAPEHPEPMAYILDEVESEVLPHVTHWQHPGFMAYFASSASGPGIVAELVMAGLNANAMLWRTSPVAAELETLTIGWLREGLGLPDAFDGLYNDTASTSSLSALAAARQAATGDAAQRGLSGSSVLDEARGLRIYASAEAHSSIEKAAMILGLGRDGVRRVATDEDCAMHPAALASAIAEDREAGWIPCAVVATIGTTSSTAIDPVAVIADICLREGIWLHVDAAYAGPVALVPERRGPFRGWERADSIVLNPHKWLFTPLDCSLLLTRRMDVLRDAFSLVPEYLRTTGGAASGRDYNEYAPQLGRRARAIKMWVLLRYFGLSGLRSRIEEHIGLAQALAGWIDAEPDAERLAPVPFSTVCFRWRPARHAGHEDEATVAADLDDFNERLMARLNATGEVFISHTRLSGRYTLRAAIGNVRTERRHVEHAWELIRSLAREMDAHGR